MIEELSFEEINNLIIACKWLVVFWIVDICAAIVFSFLGKGE
jgi:hypothetical protein